MRKVLTLLLTLAAIAAAQAASLSITGPAVANTGAAVTVTVSLVSGGGPAGVQWDMTGLPAGATVTSSVAGKVASCTATRCILAGTGSTANATAIPDGAIATIQYSQPTAAVSVQLANSLGATPAGAAAAIAPPTGAVTVGIQSHCDVNGDGKIDGTDIGLTLQQALASTTGSPTILDVIREIIAANGGACLR